MRVFVTGATGSVGSAIVKDLLAAGHQVVGLVRSDENARRLASAGGEPLLGSLKNVDILKTGAARTDGIIHTAFGLGRDLSKIAEAAKEEREAIEAFGSSYEGSDRPILVTGGVGLLPRGQRFSEEMKPGAINPAFPRAAEQASDLLAERGLRATAVRLPRCVHGAGETHGFIPRLISLAREKGVSAFVGDGENLWPSVHRLDAARVFHLALEHRAIGGPFHAIAEEGVPFKAIAAAIGRCLRLPTRSIAPAEAGEHFGSAAMFIAGHGPATSERTRARLGWQPRELDLISDIEQSYA